MSDLIDARWGDRGLPDWRAEEGEDDPTDDDADDELLAETPADVIEMLGFDPLELDDVRADADDAPLTFEDPEHNMLHAAGVLIRCATEDGGERVLFVKHAERGTWEFPGGGIEEGESAEEAAEREVREEVGAMPYGRLSLLMRDRLTGVDYTTFQARAKNTIEPTLSAELSEYAWLSPDTPPEPLHPGARLALVRMRMNELDIAKAIASGELPSPQQYENVWLFALRITGTGISYRPQLNEHVWRDPGIYLNSLFLERCNGLMVIWQHPESETLTPPEFREQVVGAVMLPYLVEDEVWGIAKIYDWEAAEMMLDLPLSTSPAVVFRDQSINQIRKLAGGEHLLIEGAPSLIDHLAVCELGVWDKGGQPTGIADGEPVLADAEDVMPEERQDSCDARADQAWVAFDQLLRCADYLLERFGE